MAEFVYNNAKNASTSYMPFKLNCGYHLRVFFKKNINPRFQLKTANKLSKELQELMTIYQETLHYAEKFQKQAHNKGVKPKKYAPGDKSWLNGKYIKTK